jgi:hypothetical protein
LRTCCRMTEQGTCVHFSITLTCSSRYHSEHRFGASRTYRWPKMCPIQLERAISHFPPLSDKSKWPFLTPTRLHSTQSEITKVWSRLLYAIFRGCPEANRDTNSAAGIHRQSPRMSPRSRLSLMSSHPEQTHGAQAKGTCQIRPGNM